MRKGGDRKKHHQRQVTQMLVTFQRTHLYGWCVERALRFNSATCTSMYMLYVLQPSSKSFDRIGAHTETIQQPPK